MHFWPLGIILVCRNYNWLMDRVKIPKIQQPALILTEPILVPRLWWTTSDDCSRVRNGGHSSRVPANSTQLQAPHLLQPQRLKINLLVINHISVLTNQLPCSYPHDSLKTILLKLLFREKFIFEKRFYSFYLILFYLYLYLLFIYR